MAIIFRGTGADPGTIQLSQIVTPGVVIAATVLCITPNTEAFSLYATIGVGEVNPGALVDIKVQLAAGYIHRNKAITWTGIYPLTANDNIFLTLVGDLTQTAEAHFKRLPNLTPETIGDLLRGRTISA